MSAYFVLRGTSMPTPHLARLVAYLGTVRSERGGVECICSCNIVDDQGYGAQGPGGFLIC